LYQQYAVALINSGNAYYGYSGSFDEARKLEEEQGKTFIGTMHENAQNGTTFFVT
jgi:glutamyl/glutaminyl-tRNA synthetase